MEIKLILKEIEILIIDYFGNIVSSDAISKKMGKDPIKVGEIMAQAQRNWDSVTVDEDGPNKEQDKELDEVIDDTVNALNAI